jgi:hypothetical protein
MIQEEDQNMEAVKANILAALTTTHKDKGALFYDFRLGLEQETAEERTVQSLIFAFNAWSGTQWRINDSLKDIISDAKQIQKNVRECKDTNTKVMWAQSQLTEYVSKSKEIENGIWQLCTVIGLSHTATNELFKQVHSFIDFDSFI